MEWKFNVVCKVCHATVEEEMTQHMMTHPPTVYFDLVPVLDWETEEEPEPAPVKRPGRPALAPRKPVQEPESDTEEWVEPADEPKPRKRPAADEEFEDLSIAHNR